MRQIIEVPDRYRIVELVAEGGMGAVYRAQKLGAAGFEKTVAIKTLLPKFSSDPAFVDGFIGEAKLVANLIHENIVQIYNLERWGEGYFFVLEFVDGISLYDFIEFHRRIGRMLPLNLAVFITARVARGLAYAHSRRSADSGEALGIVHCDVCPHNILINSEGVPKITDFGIARVTNRAPGGKVAGKLAFVAPEQARGETVDFRADLYSLGIVLAYLITGRMLRNIKLPVTEILENAKRNVLERGILPADLPPEMKTILERLLATDPADRYSDTSALARDLEYFIYKEGYGPTIVTLANYMKELMPGRFGAGSHGPEVVDEFDRTVVLDRTAILDVKAQNGK